MYMYTHARTRNTRANTSTHLNPFTPEFNATCWLISRWWQARTHAHHIRTRTHADTRPSSYTFHVHISLLPFLSHLSLSFSLTPPGFIRFSPRNTQELCKTHTHTHTLSHTHTQHRGKGERVGERERERERKRGRRVGESVKTSLTFWSFPVVKSSSIRRGQNLAWSNHFFHSPLKKGRGKKSVRFN